MAAELLAELGVEDIYDDKLVDRAIDDLNASDEGDEGDYD